MRVPTSRTATGPAPATGRHATAPSARPSRLSGLDALRFVAALAVLAYHFTVKSPASPAWGGNTPGALDPVGHVAVYGAMGVSLFFVISGFVILMTAWGRDVPHFVASRIGRLFPGYWASVVVSAVVVVGLWPAALPKGLTKAQVLLNLTMVQASSKVPDLQGVYWTLFYEARFYLLIAVFVMIGLTRNRVLAFAGLWPVLGAVAQSSGQQFLTTLLMPDYAPYFAGGMVIFLMYRDGRDVVSWLLLGLNVVLAANFATAWYGYQLPLDTQYPVSKVVLGLVSTACFGLVALVSLTRLRHVHARWMVTAGALSYPLYLMHQNTGYLVIHVLSTRTSPWIALGAAYAQALVLALLLHHLVEKPFGNRLRRAVLEALRRGSAATAGRRAADAAPVPDAAEPAIPAPSSAGDTARFLPVPAADAPAPAAWAPSAHPPAAPVPPRHGSSRTTAGGPDRHRPAGSRPPGTTRPGTPVPAGGRHGDPGAAD